MSGAIELKPAELRKTCDPAQFDFQTTADLPPLNEVLGQPRAVAALEFGVGIASHGFNLFALGQPGSGKTTLIREYLERLAASEPVPPDLCYVHNFARPRHPLPLKLPPGRGDDLRRDVAALIDELKSAIPKAFENEEYTSQRDRIIRGFEEIRQKEFESMEKSVESSGFKLVKTAGGLLLAPATGGKLIGEEELDKLTAEEREKVARVRERVQRDIEAKLRGVREREKEARDRLSTLDDETAAYATRHLMDELISKYRKSPEAVGWLNELQKDVIRNADDFRRSKESESPQNPLASALGMGKAPAFTRYEVNVLVDNRETKGAPVVVETNPNYHNLTGRIEHQSTLGEIRTDHTMIKPGALHRAAGGYLVVPARECLMQPFAWEGLKRALKDREINIEELGTQLGLISTVTLDPEPVPLDAKVLLIGSPTLYYLLFAYDEDFQKLFKVKAEFTTRMDRTPEAERAYGLFAGALSRAENTRPLDRGAVARIVEYGSRSADDQDRLSTIFGEIADLIREASHRASQNSHDAITAQDIRATEEARRYRLNLMEERLQEAMLRGTIIVDTQGSAVGRINGLSVIGLGDAQFGHPSRITATVGPGKGGVVSIEREVELSGPIHGKGVLILSGFLLRKYGTAAPLSLSASLVFEQMYGMVEGDSASLAELCCLISALSGVPIRQDLAMTGSVNQHGQVQPVGGISEKIEGFFDTCNARGLTGSQGVAIPATNKSNLMLRDDVVEAVAAGRFHIWTVTQVDEALALLTSRTPGEPGADGVYPEDSIHRAVADRLASYSGILKALGEAKPGAGGGGS